MSEEPDKKSHRAAQLLQEDVELHLQEKRRR